MDRRRPAWALLGAVPLVALGSGGKTAEVWALLSAGLLFSAALWALRGEGAVLLKHPIFPGVAGALILHTAAWLVSPSLAQGFAAVSKVWVLVIFGAGAWLTWSQPTIRVFFNLVMAGAAAQAALIYWAGWRGVGPFLLFPGNPQYAGLWLGVAALLGLDRAADGFRLNRRGLGWALLALAAAGALFLLRVRSMMLGGLAGLAFWAWKKFGRRGVLAVFALGAILTAVLPRQTWEKGLKTDQALAWKRPDIWRTAVAGALARPVLGWGPGHFEVLYREHAVPQDTLPLRFELTTRFAHNDYLQAAAEAGIPALFFWLAALAGLVWSRPGGPAPAAGITLWLVASFFNFPLALPLDGLLVAGLFACLKPQRTLRLAPPGPFLARAARVTFLVTVSLLALGNLAWFGGALSRRFGGETVPWDPRWPEEQLTRAQELVHRPDVAPNVPEAYRRLDRLLRFYPQAAEGWQFEGHLSAEHDRPPRLREAYQFFARAAALWPGQAAWRREWAGLAEAAGLLPDAQILLRQTLGLEPLYGDAALALGRVIRLSGEPGRAEGWLLSYMRRRTEPSPPPDSPYGRAVLEWKPQAFWLEIARCRTDMKRPRAAQRASP